MKTCVKCGADNKADKAACWSCSAPLDQAQRAAPPRPGAAARRKRSHGMPIAAIAIVLLAIAGGGAYYFFLLHGSAPEDVAQAYVSAISSGDVGKRDALSIDPAGGASTLPPMLGITGYEVDRKGVTVEGTGAEVSVMIHLTLERSQINPQWAAAAEAVAKHMESNPVKAAVVLVKQGKHWRVDQGETQRRFVESALSSLPPMVQSQLRPGLGR